MPDDIGPGHLLLIAAMAPPADVERALAAHIRPEDLRVFARWAAGAEDSRMDGSASAFSTDDSKVHPPLSTFQPTLYLAYADAAPAVVRDWLAGALGAGVQAFVVEFERWSALGNGPDHAWLHRRGH